MNLVADELIKEYKKYIANNPSEKDKFTEPIIEGLSA